MNRHTWWLTVGLFFRDLVNTSWFSLFEFVQFHHVMLSNLPQTVTFNTYDLPLYLFFQNQKISQTLSWWWSLVLWTAHWVSSLGTSDSQSLCKLLSVLQPHHIECSGAYTPDQNVKISLKMARINILHWWILKLDYVTFTKKNFFLHIY